MNERTETMTRGSAPQQLHDGSYADWSAILVGGVIAAGVASVFSTFGAAIGFSTIGGSDASTGPKTGAMIAIACWIIWTAVSAVMAGGYVTGRMRRRIDPSSTADAVAVRDGIHGLAVWGVAVLLGAYVLGGAASTVATTAGQAAPSISQAMTGTEAQPAAAASTAGTAVTGTQAQAAAPQMTEAEKAEAARKTKAYAVISAFAIAASLMIAAAGGYWAAGMGGRHRDENRVFARFGTWN